MVGSVFREAVVAAVDSVVGSVFREAVVAAVDSVVGSVVVSIIIFSAINYVKVKVSNKKIVHCCTLNIYCCMQLYTDN